MNRTSFAELNLLILMVYHFYIADVYELKDLVGVMSSRLLYTFGPLGSKMTAPCFDHYLK